ncbi:hypothetical protein BRC83_02855 [Halobacteriales archaeon QS_1_68_17]|nr:MAG: hypothetical protein BRC83_02855 [Halobacteriales archaeon QS_1_68_17]
MSALRAEYVATTVIEAIADVEGVAPRDLQAPLYDWVDAEALSALFDTDRPNEMRVEFRVEDHEVAVTADEVVVDGNRYDLTRSVGQ